MPVTIDPPDAWRAAPLTEADADCHPLANVVLEPDRDIAGRGVIASFVASGVLALVIVTIYYLLVFDPKVTQFPDRGRKLTTRQSSLSTRDTVRWAAADYEVPNPVDEYMFELQSRFYAKFTWRPRIFPSKTRIEECFRRCILGLSDLQILTGLCVLIAGFSSIDTIPAFYWQIIVYVAWFSNLTHQCGLIFLRRYFHRKPWERGWRVFLITCLLILLIVATIPTMYFNWRNDSLFSSISTPNTAAQPGTPVRCLYNHKTRSYMHERTFDHPGVLVKFFFTRAFQNTMITLSFLITSYVTRMIKLFNTTANFFRDRVRRPAGWLVRRISSWMLRTVDRLTFHKIGPEPWYLLFETPMVASYLFFRLYLDLYSSVLSDVCWLYAGTLIGLWRIIAEKYDEPKYVPDAEAFKAEDKMMDFGQLLPLMLLASPILGVVGTFSHQLATDEALSSSRLRAVEGLDENAGENENESAAQAQASQVSVDGKSGNRLPSLRDGKNRWKRLNILLEEENYWTSLWFSAAVFCVCLAEIMVFLVVYINLVISHGVQTIFFQGLTAIAIFMPLSVLPIQIGISIQGWNKKAAWWLCWLCTAIITGVFIWVCFRFSLTVDLITLYVTTSLSVLGYPVVCLVVCMLPKSWTWGRPVVKQSNVSREESVELGEGQSGIVDDKGTRIVA